MFNTVTKELLKCAFSLSDNRGGYYDVSITIPKFRIRNNVFVVSM